MAATKYQVLYRYINEATNTAITNSMDNAYDPVCEFYTDPDHKIFSNSPNVQAEAVNEQQEMIFSYLAVCNVNCPINYPYCVLY